MFACGKGLTKHLGIYISRPLNTMCKVKSIPNDKSLDMTKFKTFADHKLIVANMTISFFERVKNLCEKEKMLVTSIFFSHRVFQSPLPYGCLKSGLCSKGLRFKITLPYNMILAYVDTNHCNVTHQPVKYRRQFFNCCLYYNVL